VALWIWSPLSRCFNDLQHGATKIRRASSLPESYVVGYEGFERDVAQTLGITFIEIQ
jgi:hypothetical protein